MSQQTPWPADPGRAGLTPREGAEEAGEKRCAACRCLPAPPAAVGITLASEPAGKTQSGLHAPATTRVLIRLKI